MTKEPFLINPQKRAKRKSAKKSTRRNPKRKRSSARKNPYGQEVIVVGANPRRRRKKATRKRKTSRRRKRNPVARAPRRRAVKRTRRNPVRRTAKRRSYRRNPVRKRRARRNMPMAVGTMNVKKPMTLLMPLGTGIAALVITKMVPNTLNLTGNMRIAAQVAVAIGGGYILQKPIGKQNAMIFTIVSLVNTASEILSQRVGGVFAGLGAFVDEYAQPTMLSDGPDGMMGDFVDTGSFGEYYDENMGAFVTGDPDDPYGGVL